MTFDYDILVCIVYLCVFVCECCALCKGLEIWFSIWNKMCLSQHTKSLCNVHSFRLQWCLEKWRCIGEHMKCELFGCSGAWSRGDVWVSRWKTYTLAAFRPWEDDMYGLADGKSTLWLLMEFVIIFVWITAESNLWQLISTAEFAN